MPKISREIKEEKKEALLRSLEGGVSITDACKAASVSRHAIWEWRKKSKRFDNKVNSIIDSRTQSMEDALYASGIKGNVAAQIFWLKNRAKDRWSDRTTHEIALELTFANLMKMKKEQEKKTKTNRILSMRGG